MSLQLSNLREDDALARVLTLGYVLHGVEGLQGLKTSETASLL